MITSIHQPSFFPWLGLIDKIARSNYLVLLNDVAANKASYQYRNIFYCNGEPKFLNLPVNYNLGVTLNNLKFKNSEWADDHLNKIKNYYLKAPYFNEIYPLVEEFYLQNKNNSPYEVISKSMFFLFDIFNIKVEIIESINLNCIEKKGDLVLEICEKLNVKNYISGKGAKAYMDNLILKKFEQKNINIIWQEFKHPKYIQNPKKEFIEGLSSLDLLFFLGIENSNLLFWSTIK